MTDNTEADTAADGAALWRTWDGRADPEALGRALFHGALVLFPAIEPIHELCAHVRALLVTHFRDDDPPTVEARIDVDAFRKAATAARNAVKTDETVDRLWRAALVTIGYEPAAVFQDRMRLRVVPALSQSRGRFVRPMPAQRDSWGSGVMAQINWWLPLYPLAPTRTMVIWPNAFAAPIDNTSADWDYDVLMSGARKNYPLLPEARQAPAGAGVPVLIGPETLLAFSAAHLHASVAEDRSQMRLSLDTRTAWDGDVQAGRGAPNVDGPGTPPRWDMFERAAAAAG